MAFTKMMATTRYKGWLAGKRERERCQAESGIRWSRLVLPWPISASITFIHPPFPFTRLYLSLCRRPTFRCPSFFPPRTKSCSPHLDDLELHRLHRSAAQEAVAPLDRAVGVHEIRLHKHVVNVARDACGKGINKKQKEAYKANQVKAARTRTTPNCCVTELKKTEKKLQHLSDAQTLSSEKEQK